MKLTKGKISRLYNKKKQTFKKPKKRLSRKRKTLRNRKHLNLARRTLKRQPNKKRGGSDENMTPIKGEEQDKDQDHDQHSTTGEQEHNIDPSIIEDLKMDEQEPTIEQDQPTVAPELHEQSTEEQPTVAPELQDEERHVTIQEPIEEEPSPVEENYVEEKPEEILNQEPNSALVQSISQVVDYVANTVADKVSERVMSGQSGENIQNGFQSVNVAARNMATGGSRFKRTRKFRLSK